MPACFPIGPADVLSEAGLQSHPHSAAGAGVSAFSCTNEMAKKSDIEELERGQSAVYAESEGKLCMLVTMQMLGSRSSRDRPR